MAADGTLLGPQDAPADPLEVLENDPILGLLMLGLLPLLADELNGTDTGSKAAALRLLHAVVCAGHDATASLAQCKPALEGLRAILATGALLRKLSQRGQCNVPGLCKDMKAIDVHGWCGD